MRRDDAYLLDMLVAARKAVTFAADLTYPQFVRSDLHQNAIFKVLEIVGEGASRVGEDTRQTHPDISWHQIVGLRNRIVHAYFEIDLDVVWRVEGEGSPRHTGFDDKRDYDRDRHKADGGGRVVLREKDTKLLDEKRADYRPHVFEGNVWLVLQNKARPDLSPPLVISNIGDLNQMNSGVYSEIQVSSNRTADYGAQAKGSNTSAHARESMRDRTARSTRWPGGSWWRPTSASC